MAVTTALCADQAVVAASSLPPAREQAAAEFGNVASRLVGRLTQNLRRAMPAAVCEPERQARPAVVVVARRIDSQRPTHQHAPVSPFQFRLPPPSA